jgi:hypothetical protein
MGGMRAYEKKGDPRFLLPPIRPIFPLLPVLALKRNGAMLRCQIKRQKKTDPKEPYRMKADMAEKEDIFRNFFQKFNHYISASKSSIEKP